MGVVGRCAHVEQVNHETQEVVTAANHLTGIIKQPNQGLQLFTGADLMIPPLEQEVFQAILVCWGP